MELGKRQSRWAICNRYHYHTTGSVSSEKRTSYYKKSFVRMRRAVSGVRGREKGRAVEETGQRVTRVPRCCAERKGVGYGHSDHGGAEVGFEMCGQPIFVLIMFG